MLIEHYGGAFPLWLAPVQISILTISEKQTGFAENLLKYLKENAIRVEANFDNEKIGYKIRESTVSKIPFAVIIGDKEVESGKVTVRKRNGENLGPLTREELLSMLQGELKAKK
jgi:threonyl-tRNA synthetase